MPAELTGPDFIALIVHDLEASRTFWIDTIELQPAPASPPGAQVFATQPVSFAIRSPRPDESAGVGGTAIWFAFDGDIDAYAEKLSGRGVHVSAIQPGPFGRFFAFTDPQGRSITVHAKG